MLKIFTVYDSKAEAFLQPFYAAATGAAIRSFEHAANEEGHDFERYAADYTLFELGEFNVLTGEITTLTAMLNLGVAAIFQKLPPQVPSEIANITPKGVN